MRNGMRALAGAVLGLAMLSSASAQDAPPRDPNFGRGERVSGQTFATRSPVIAPHGAAATAHPLATQTAIDVLRNGGTAIDAAIAANAMLGLVEPTGNGIGGDIFVIVWDPRTQRLYGYNGSGRTPRGMSLAEMRREARRRGNPNAVPSFGAASVSVPGTVDGWFALHERFGRTPMTDLLAPTIRYAREGAPIPQTIAMYWANNRRRLEAEFAAGRLQEIQNARDTYWREFRQTGLPARVDPAADEEHRRNQIRGLMPDGHSLFANPDLANTLELLATGGRDAYYRGPIARTIDAYMRRIGGWLRYDDLARHQGEWVDPICADYRDVEVCELPPNSQGVVALQTLRILEAYNLREMGFLSADSLHTQIEATRLAFADRAQFYGDPAFTNFDTRRLLTDEYTAQRRAMISNERAMPPPPHAHLSHHRRQRRHDGVAHSVELSRHGLRPRARSSRLHAARPRRTLLTRKRPPERLRTRPAPLPNHHSRLRAAQRPTVARLRRHGRRHAAARPRANHRQPHRLRHGPASRWRRCALSLLWRRRTHRR